jgi:AcrR family transcriptional regulator
LKEGTKGLQRLTISRLEKKSGRSKQIIYLYFQSLKGVFRSFCKENDPWLQYNEEFAKLPPKSETEQEITPVMELLKCHLTSYIKDPLAQKIGSIELHFQTDHNILKDITISRTQLVQSLFEASIPLLSKGGIDLRILYALLLGGINYLNLHKNTLQDSFCEVDIYTDQQIVLTTINKIITCIHNDMQQQINLKHS